MILNYFTKKECDSIIQYTESLNNWEFKESENYSYSVSSVNLSDEISNKIKLYLKNILNLSLLNVNTLLIKYNVNDYMGRHYDRNDGTDFNKDFLYNINVRLNDDFEGGEFYLKDKIFESQVGDVYHYKSTEWHEVKPITHGVRYVALFYIRERDIGINKIF